MTPPCRKSGYHAGELIQTLIESCQDCGHTNLVHPGRHNRTVEACVLCVLLNETAQDT